jgi:hypothetical protein
MAASIPRYTVYVLARGTETYSAKRPPPTNAKRFALTSVGSMIRSQSEPSHGRHALVVDLAPAPVPASTHSLSAKILLYAKTASCSMNNHDQDSEAPASSALSQSDGEVELPTHPTDDELDRVARSLLSAGRANLPLKIEGEPLSPDDPHRHFTHVKLGTPEFVRMWMGALLQRTLDGYEATLLLRQAALDVDARAHIRIAFEHLCAFAWVSASDGGPVKSMRRHCKVLAICVMSCEGLWIAHPGEWSPIRKCGYVFLQITQGHPKAIGVRQQPAQSGSR